jgi:hypothetical protein
VVEGRIVELLGLRSGAILSNDRDEKLFSQLLILSIQKIIVGCSTFQVLHPIFDPSCFMGMEGRESSKSKIERGGCDLVGHGQQIDI